jgi:hypothetical protein
MIYRLADNQIHQHNNHTTTMTMRWHDIPDDPDEEAEQRDEEARDMADELREDE